MRFAINKYFYLSLIIFSIISIRIALGDELPSYCEDDPGLAVGLNRLGPVMGLGSSVSHGLLARSASEIVADQLCLAARDMFFRGTFRHPTRKRSNITTSAGNPAW